jgi:hypothetical protein
MRSAKWGVVILLAAWGTLAGAQQTESQPAQQASQQASGQKQNQRQEDPLADAARRAREKKAAQAKAAKVFDNDNIPTTPASISVVGEAKAETIPPEKSEGAGAEGAAAARSGNGENASVDEQQKAELQKELADAKDHLQTTLTDLDIATRKLALDQQTYYGKPNFATDEEGAAALKVEETLMASKKQDVADAQKKVDEIREKLKELESGPPKPSSTPE